jgi:transcription initiation factor TFIIIB Brf1 subunit/transcription initiation factor TFIIB
MHALQISNLEKNVWHLFEEYQSASETGYGRSGALALHACIYVLIRQNKFPLTLMDILVGSYSKKSFGHERELIKHAKNSHMLRQRMIKSMPLHSEKLIPKSFLLYTLVFLLLH